MIISHRYKFVYFSIPKTGSESCRKMLYPFLDEKVVAFPKTTKNTPFYPHMTPSELIEAFENFGYDYRKYNFFATVRNPWARVYSLYKMAKRMNKLQKNCTFNQFVNIFYSKNSLNVKTKNKWFDHGLINYKTFIQNNKLKVKIFKIETEKNNFLNSLISIDVPLNLNHNFPKINVATSVNEYIEYFDQEAFEIIKNFYESDIRIYNYKFEDN